MQTIPLLIILLFIPPYPEMTTWQFPSKEQWVQAWQSAHAVYASEIDPDDHMLCQALLWHARAVCQQKNEKS